MRCAASKKDRNRIKEIRGKSFTQQPQQLSKNCSVPKVKVRTASPVTHPSDHWIIGIQVLWLTHGLFDCHPWQRRNWSGKPLSNQMEQQCIHQFPNWDLHHCMLEVMDTSNMHSRVCVMSLPPPPPTHLKSGLVVHILHTVFPLYKLAHGSRVG